MHAQGTHEVDLPGEIEAGLSRVRRIMGDAVARSPLGASHPELLAFLSAGKMLRGRLVLRLAPACGTPPELAERVAAVVEMVHAASLLHDDVIDGGKLRRSVPTFWVTHGVQAAILVGDWFFFDAVAILQATGDTGLMNELIRSTSDVCRAEVEQELLLRGAAADWETALALARRKTGALFAFAAVAACRSAGGDTRIREALREVGYQAGTAYQLSDDILDGGRDASIAGKTLGRDEARDKVTAARAGADGARRAQRFVAQFPPAACAALQEWPAVAAAWAAYWETDLAPALGVNLDLGRGYAFL